MKKPGIIFAFVAFYAIVAFTWWTIAHIKSTHALHDAGKENLELLCYKASDDLRGAIDQHLFNDTNDAKYYVNFNFPELEILFVEPEQHINPFDYYLIRPSKAAYERLDNKMNRAVWMYTTEGFVMVLLLIWGIVWIYRSLQTRLAFNKQQNNFMLSITHELKTPLASVKLYVETLLKRDLDKAQSTTILKNSLSELMRLRDLVNNILMAAQLEDKNFNIMNTEVNLTEVAHEAFQKYITPRGLGESCTCEIEDDVFVEGDALSIEAVITNLMSNAHKYGGPETQIALKVYQRETDVILAVSDNGPGISDDVKKHLFKRFYRSGDEQTRKTKGTGLGLFIVKNLLNLMKAEISVKDNTPKGTTFEITFKKYYAI